LVGGGIALPAVSDERSGLKTFDLVLLIGGGVIAALVAFALLHFVAGIIWFAIKFIFVVAVIGIIAWWLIGRRK
jgi:thiamine transporter ThiT